MTKRSRTSRWRSADLDWAGPRADALDAPWDALAVTEPARDIPGLAAAERRLPDRPRVILTDDQLHAEHVFWAMGSNPFAWDPRTAEQDRDRERSFSRWLSANDPDVPWDRVADTLLDRTLGALCDRAEDAPGLSDPPPRPSGESSTS